MQGKRLYVGNLGYSVTNEQLQSLFSNHGEIMQINIVKNKGFGFVEMGSHLEAEKAKEALNGLEFEGRSLRVEEARAPIRR